MNASSRDPSLLFVIGLLLLAGQDPLHGGDDLRSLLRSLADRKFRIAMDLWKRRCNLGESLGWYNNHMWRYILPPEKYVDKHPEWFAMLNGRRSKESFGADEGLKICTSNLEALKEFARVSVEKAKKQKTNYISITPNDGIRFCECPECTRDDLKAEDGSAIMSNRMFLYANRLAEMITRELPDVKIAMLAYSQYKEPPIYRNEGLGTLCLDV